MIEFEKSSTSLPGGNQVDDLPPASSVADRQDNTKATHYANNKTTIVESRNNGQQHPHAKRNQHIVRHIEENAERPRPTQGRLGNAKHRSAAHAGLTTEFLEEKKKEEAKGNGALIKNTASV